VLIESFRGGASEVVPKFVCQSDPAAQWTGAHKGHAFFAYADNYLIDLKGRDHSRRRGDTRNPPSRGRRRQNHDRTYC
jgi:hypothetical protein